MKVLRLGFVSIGLSVGLLGCPQPDAQLCDRSAKADRQVGGSCAVPPLLGTSCVSNLSFCTETDRKTLQTVVGCVEKLEACFQGVEQAWIRARNACASPVSTLSQPCLQAIFAGSPPGVDAGEPDAGPPPITDGGNGVELFGVANQNTVALAWELYREGAVDRWMLVETDGVGEHRTETQFRIDGGLHLLIPDAGMNGRRYFVVGLNALGQVVTGTPLGEAPVDGGAPHCRGPNECPEDEVCDLGKCRVQRCTFQAMNTCPATYQCFSPGLCRRTSADGGIIMTGGRRDGGTHALPLISNEIALTPRPPLVQPTVNVGSVSGKRPDIAALDTAHVALALEQEAQVIAHSSAARGKDFAEEIGTSFGIDTVGGRPHLAWNAESDALFTCYVVGRGVRVQKSSDRGRTWGVSVLDIEVDGETIRDCDIAPWKRGGALLVTTENNGLVVRELNSGLFVTFNEQAFTSDSPDAGARAVFAPAHPALATLPSSGLVHITFTGTRLLLSGATDTEPYGVFREGAASFSSPTRMTPTAQPSALPEDWTAVSINPANGRVLGAFTSVQTGTTENSTVYISLFSTITRSWNTGSHLNVFVVDQNTSVWLPQKPPPEVWYAFSPALAPLRDGTFAFSFVAGPYTNMSGDYRQYLAIFDLDRVPSITAGKGWFVPPVLKMSEERVLDPRSSTGTPPPPVSALTADSQISIYGAFIPGGGPLGDREGPAKFFAWP